MSKFLCYLGRYSEFAIPHTRRNSQTLLIPDCPPPAYTPINIIIDEIQRNSTSNELVTLPIDIFSRKSHSNQLVLLLYLKC